MAVTVVPNLTVLSLAQDNTGGTWVGTSGAFDTEVFYQGSASWYYQTPKSGVGDGNFTPTAAVNMSAADTHLYWAMKCDVFPFCELLNTGATASGLMVKIESSATDYVTWHIAGKDTWGGEWKQFVLDVNNTTNKFATVGTLNLAAVTKVSFLTDNSNSGNIRIIDNTNINAVRFGTGLTAYGSDFTLQDIALDDQLVANKYGVVAYEDGVVFVQGRVTIDDNGATTTFNSTNEKLGFRDKVVSANLYQLEFTGTGNTAVIKGLNVFSSGVNDDTRPNVICDGTVGSLTIDGSNFDRVGTVNFKSGQSIKTTVFNNTELITPSTAIFQLNTVSNCLATRALKIVASHNISDCTFSDNVNATWYDTIGSYDDDGNSYIGNTFDVENSSVGLVTVTKLNGSNPITFTNTNGGSVSITASFLLSLTNIPTGVQVTIVNSSTRAELQNSTTTGVTVTYTHAGGETVDILFMANNYDPNSSDIYNLPLPNENSSIKISLADDINYDNP